MNERTVRGAAAVFAAATMTLAAAAYAAGTPEQKCEGGKNDAAGKYAACVAKAEKGFVTSGDGAKYGVALGKCETKMISTWGKLEQKAVDAMTTCPSTGDQSDIEDFLDACTQSVAVAVGGGSLPLDVVTCNGDLATCSGDLSATNADLAICDGDLATCDADLAACESSPAAMPLKTGQTNSYGAGSDGDLEKGAARSFTDNGDGTITDNATGLMWEKKSDDDSIHDKDNTYTWSTGTNDMDGTIVTTFLADLNGGGGFAGYTDWRIPNQFELFSRVNLAAVNPAVYSEFDSACASGCTVTTCNCTRSIFHWSSTTYQVTPSSAWGVSFANGTMGSTNKTIDYYVRAVRAGS